MKVVFLGTPDFALPSLEALKASRHEILAVVTQPDKPVGRKAVLTPPPVKQAALEYGLEVFQYEKLSRDGVSDLKALSPDVMVTCAFGQILSKEVLNIPKYGVINVHGSLLPKYRGAAPVQYAVINGDAETGVTIMQTEEGVDTGDMLGVEKTPIGEDETAGELFDRLSVIGGKLLVKVLDELENGSVVRIKQDEKEATHVKMLTKESGRIVWSKSASTIKNLVRGVNPWPVASTTVDGKLLKIFEVGVVEGVFSGEVGEVVEAEKRLLVKCGENALEIKRLQIEGGKAMSAQAFIAGRKLKKGDILK